MIDSDTLMRYIRVFRNFPIRFEICTQRECLVEIALIKLCRPVMETNLDSFLDRIRVLEEKMEQGV